MADTPSRSERKTPKAVSLLTLGNQFEKMFLRGYVDDARPDLLMRIQTPVLRSLGSARSHEDPHKRRPTVIAGVGRTDLLVCFREGELRTHAVVEVKNTFWDRLRADRVRPRLGAHRRQIWGYVEPMLMAAERGLLGDPQAFVIYPTRPSVSGRADQVEEYLAEYGIVVAYADELLDGTGSSDAEGTSVAVGPCHCGEILTTIYACDRCSPDVRIRPSFNLESRIKTHDASCDRRADSTAQVPKGQL